jgi:hypothetical protein
MTWSTRALSARPYPVITTDAGEYKLQFSGTASAASYQTALRAVQFNNDGPYNAQANRTFTFKVTDASGASTNNTRVVTIVETNDAPEVPTSPLEITGNEDYNIISAFENTVDEDSQNLTFRITCAPSLGRAWRKMQKTSFIAFADPRFLSGNTNTTM